MTEEFAYDGVKMPLRRTKSATDMIPIKGTHILLTN